MKHMLKISAVYLIGNPKSVTCGHPYLRILFPFVKTTGIPEASFLYDTGDIFLLCYKKQIGLQFKFVLLAQIWDPLKLFNSLSQNQRFLIHIKSIPWTQPLKIFWFLKSIFKFFEILWKYLKIPWNSLRFSEIP